jgi:threonylcarbamoyladenosine tRNA methylthiotransferase MtaB
MNRKYDTKVYKKSVDILRKYITEPSITTDIIVGFPGETQEDFLECYNFAKEINFSKIHVFKFSARVGTVAYNMKPQISNIVKEERSLKMIELSDIMQKNYIEKFIGQKLDVLYEGKVHQSEGYLEGFTTNYIKVFAKGAIANRGSVIPTLLVKSENDYVLGDMSV